MFFKQKVIKDEYVSCETCKCLLKREDAQAIIDVGILSAEMNRYYCGAHTKNYNKSLWKINSLNNFCKVYYKDFKVNEHGEPIGYKKIKSN